MSFGPLDQINDAQALVQWAKEKGVQLDGVKPASLPGRGVGIVAIRTLKEGDILLVIPKDVIRSLHSLPDDVSLKLPPDMPIHGLLAADLALDKSSAPWNSVLPSYADFESSVPYMWPAELQDLLPLPAKKLLAKQQEKIERHWKMFTKAFPDTSRRDFLHGWFLVNTRTFYYETPETQLYPWEDRLALLPVADLFNHTESGCHVQFTSDWYSITADRTYEAGDEVHISYGEHSNDFLLAEYGFVLDKNRWDEVCLDDAVIPKLKKSQKLELEKEELLGDYMLSDHGGPSNRTKMVLMVLSSKDEKWQKVLRDEEKVIYDAGAVGKTLKDLCQESLTMARGKLTAVEKKDLGNVYPRSMLVLRWKQIINLLEKNI